MLSKNNVGRVLPTQWVFGGICRQTRETFIVPVQDKTAETLLAVVRAKIAVGSTVMSDCWRSYNMVVLIFVLNMFFTKSLDQMDPIITSV